MRLFFAIFPPPAVAARLARIARAKADEWGGKATRAETIHLTLAFLGDVASDRLATLIELAARIQPPGFELEVDFCGHWRHNRLVWAGLSAPPPALIDFAGGLRGALAAADFLVERDAGQFTPHITLVRKTNLAAAPASFPLAETIRWPCTGFALVSSSLAAAGPGYQRVAEFALRPVRSEE